MLEDAFVTNDLPLASSLFYDCKQRFSAEGIARMLPSLRESILFELVEDRDQRTQLLQDLLCHQLHELQPYTKFHQDKYNYTIFANYVTQKNRLEVHLLAALWDLPFSVMTETKYVGVEYFLSSHSCFKTLAYLLLSRTNFDFELCKEMLQTYSNVFVKCFGFCNKYLGGWQLQQLFLLELKLGSTCLFEERVMHDPDVQVTVRIVRDFQRELVCALNSTSGIRALATLTVNILARDRYFWSSLVLLIFDLWTEDDSILFIKDLKRLDGLSLLYCEFAIQFNRLTTLDLLVSFGVCPHSDSAIHLLLNSAIQSGQITTFNGVCQRFATEFKEY